MANYAAFAIVCYCALVLGSLSPIHCRLTATILGFGCVMLAVQAGFGFCGILDLRLSAVHDSLPILMLGIGVDDMFVICNALDQVSLNHSPEQRLKEAMRHAGPSITITTLTNCLAFLSGSATTIPAIKSFCLYSAVTIVMLYLSVLTLFVPFMYWDTRRVASRNKECLGLFFCSEDSVMCCKGRFISEPQRIFSKVYADFPETGPESTDRQAMNGKD